MLPLRNYAGTQHVLGAPSMFVHPGNGNIYVSVIEQINGMHQDMAIYRLPGGSNAWEEVRRYRGTIESQAQVTFGSAVIGQGGHMIVVTDLVIPNAPKLTTTGFVACWERVMNVDAPYPPVGDYAGLSAQVNALATLIAGLPISDLTVIQTQLTRIKAQLAAIHNATE